MPYYIKKHLLFIHIPKTGGTSVETILGKGDGRTMYSKRKNKIMPLENLRNISLQHQKLRDIIQFRTLLPVRFDKNLIILSIVRNPYQRIVSDLFWHHLINDNSPPERVYKVIQNYVQIKYLDNHNIPQYKFLANHKNNLYSKDGVKGLYKKLIILKTEKLSIQMKNIFGMELDKYHYLNQTEKIKKNYMDFLNKNSIWLINNFYKRDFELFNYSMINLDTWKIS